MGVSIDIYMHAICGSKNELKHLTEYGLVDTTYFPNKKSCSPKHLGPFLFYMYLIKYVLLPCFSFRTLTSVEYGKQESFRKRGEEKEDFKCKGREDNLGKLTLKVTKCDR